MSQQDRIIDALCIDSIEMRTMYRTNPTFYHEINTLAAVLPIFVESLAEHAKRAEAAQRAAVEMENLIARPITVYCAGCVDREQPHAGKCPHAISVPVHASWCDETEIPCNCGAVK